MPSNVRSVAFNQVCIVRGCFKGSIEIGSSKRFHLWEVGWVNPKERLSPGVSCPSVAGAHNIAAEQKQATEKLCIKVISNNQPSSPAVNMLFFVVFYSLSLEIVG